MGLFFKSNSDPKKAKRVNIVLVIALLVGLFFGAIYAEPERASQTLLDCFTILFTAAIGLLGFEANKA